MGVTDVGKAAEGARHSLGSVGGMASMEERFGGGAEKGGTGLGGV